MAELPRYGTVAECCKCGADTAKPYTGTPATTTYHPDRQTGQSFPCAKFRVTATDLGEHQCRTCQTCGYGWCEAVLS